MQCELSTKYIRKLNILTHFRQDADEHIKVQFFLHIHNRSLY